MPLLLRKDPVFVPSCLFYLESTGIWFQLRKQYIGFSDLYLFPLTLIREVTVVGLQLFSWSYWFYSDTVGFYMKTWGLWQSSGRFQLCHLLIKLHVRNLTWCLLSFDDGPAAWMKGTLSSQLRSADCSRILKHWPLPAATPEHLWGPPPSKDAVGFHGLCMAVTVVSLAGGTEPLWLWLLACSPGQAAGTLTLLSVPRAQAPRLSLLWAA